MPYDDDGILHDVDKDGNLLYCNCDALHSRDLIDYQLSYPAWGPKGSVDMCSNCLLYPWIRVRGKEHLKPETEPIRPVRTRKEDV